MRPESALPRRSLLLRRLEISLAQDINEHRFSHIRAGLGTHKNPTAQQAKQRSSVGDVCRALNGKKRKNASNNTNARGGEEFDVAGLGGELMLAVTRGEVEREIRPWSRGTHEAVLCPRSSSTAPQLKRRRVRASVHLASRSAKPHNPYMYGICATTGRWPGEPFPPTRCRLDPTKPNTSFHSEASSHPIVDSVDELVDIAWYLFHLFF